MSTQFNPLRVARLSSPEVMAELVAACGGDSKAYLENPKTWFEALDGKTWREMLTRLYKVYEIAEHDGHGLAVALEEAGSMGVKLKFAEGETIHDKAIHLLLRHPALTHKDLQLLHVEELEGGRQWHTRKGMPGGAPDNTEKAKEELKLAVGGYFCSKEGRGEHQHIEHIVSSDETHYYFLYLSDYPQREEDFGDDGNMMPRAARPVFEIVYAYHPETRTLHTNAHGRAKHLADLQEMFASAILHGQPQPENPLKEPYQLNGLLRRDFPFPVNVEDKILLVQVQTVKVKIMGGVRVSQQSMTFSTKERDNHSALHDMLDEYINQHNLPLSRLHVTNALILVQFNERESEHSMTIDLTPKTRTIKSKTEEHRLLGENLLRRWHIEAAT